MAPLVRTIEASEEGKHVAAHQVYASIARRDAAYREVRTLRAEKDAATRDKNRLQEQVKIAREEIKN